MRSTTSTYRDSVQTMSARPLLALLPVVIGLVGAAGCAASAGDTSLIECEGADGAGAVEGTVSVDFATVPESDCAVWAALDGLDFAGNYAETGYEYVRVGTCGEPIATCASETTDDGWAGVTLLAASAGGVPRDTQQVSWSDFYDTYDGAFADPDGGRWAPTPVFTWFQGSTDVTIKMGLTRFVPWKHIVCTAVYSGESQGPQRAEFDWKVVDISGRDAEPIEDAVTIDTYTWEMNLPSVGWVVVEGEQIIGAAGFPEDLVITGTVERDGIEGSGQSNMAGPFDFTCVEG